MHQLLLLPAWVFFAWFIYAITKENQHFDYDSATSMEPPKTIKDLENERRKNNVSTRNN